MQVVLHELELRYFLQGLVPMHHAVVHLKSVLELIVGLIQRLLALFHLRMLPSIILRDYEVNVYESLLVNVQFLKGFLRKGCSVLIHWAYHNLDKFIVLHLAILIQIKGLKCILYIHIRHVNVKLPYCIVEILKSQSSHVPVINISELRP